LFTSSANTSLNLPVEEPPNFHDNDLSNWANVEDFGARGKAAGGGDDWGDDTAAIQTRLTQENPPFTFHLVSTI
jgi:hypothetical protein